MTETPAAALARHIRVLASDPKDFLALIGAGKAALELGDARPRSDFSAAPTKSIPSSPLPQAGMGAVRSPTASRRRRCPISPARSSSAQPRRCIGTDRGLAYDLLGRQAQAQADYRAALNGADGDEARRRLALSLAISGDKAGALAMLAR